VFDVDVVNIKNLRERKKWGCVCTMWSKIKKDWLQSALKECHFFLDSQFPNLCAKNDINAIVCGMEKYSWDDETTNECVWHLYKFMLKSSNEEGESDDSDSDLEGDEVVTNQDVNLNVDADNYVMDISSGDSLVKFDTIDYGEVPNYVDYSREKSSNDKNKRLVTEFEELSRFCFENTYLYEFNIYDSMNGALKNLYFEQIDSEGVTANLDLCEDTNVHIELVSQSDIVRVSIDILKQFRGDDKNMMKCSAALRLLMKLFSNPRSREKISSKECLKEIFLTVKTCKRWQDVESGFRLMMAICENNEDLNPFFFENGGLDFFTYLNDENHTLFTYFEFSICVFKLCSKQTVTNTSPVVSNLVMKVLLEASIRFIKSEIFVQSVCRTMHCLSSNLYNRQNMRIFDGMNVIQRMMKNHSGNDMIKEYVSNIISNLLSTKS